MGQAHIDRVQNAGWAFVLLGVVILALAALAGEAVVAVWLGERLERAPSMIRLHASLDPTARDLAYFTGAAVPAMFRLGGSLVALGLLIRFGGVVSGWCRMLAQPGDARDLALARVVVFGALALYVDPGEVARFAALPAELVDAPPGWGWLLAAVQPSPVWAEPLARIVVACSVGAAVGLWPRVTAWSAVILGIVVLGIPQFYGKINHYHHLVWFGAVIAASPAWDAWTFRSRADVPAAAVTYGRPIRLIWLLFACIYFFPGFWKWVVAGPAWVTGDAFATMLHAQWYRLGWVPGLRIDVGWLAAISGTTVLVFELAFAFALIRRRARQTFVVGAAAFHAGVFLLAGINFWSLAVCLVVFLPVGRMVDKVRGLPRPSAPDLVAAQRRITGPVIVALAVLSGFTGLDTWPIAVYPTFAGLPDHLYATLQVEFEDGDTLDPYRSEGLREAFGRSRIMGLAWQAVGRSSGPSHARAMVEALAAHEPRLAESDTLRLNEVHIDVRPGAWIQVRTRELARVVRNPDTR